MGISFFIRTVLVISVIGSISSVPLTNVVSVKGILDAANAIRANPNRYAQVINDRIRSKLDSKGVHAEWRFMFNEGTKAVDEAIQFLKTASPQPPLVLNQGLTRSSWEHSKW